MREASALIHNLQQSQEAVAKAVFNHPREALHYRPAPDKWSARDVVCHLLDTERFIFSQRLRRFLAETNPRFPDVDQMPFVTDFAYDEQNTLEKLEEFRIERQALINIVHSMPAAKWMMRGIHEIRGEVGPADVLNYCTEHTMVHVRQIERTLLEFYDVSQSQV